MSLRPYLRSRRLRGRRYHTISDLNLTSLTDMFAFIITFLLKTFSVSAVDVKPLADLKLPITSSQEKPHRYVAIDINESGIYLEKNLIQPLYHFALQPNAQAKDTLFDLRGQLKSKIELGEIDSTTAIIRADQRAPFDLIWKVMFTARQLGFEEFQNLAIQAAPRRL